MRVRSTRRAVLALLVFSVSGTIHAQHVPVGDEYEDYVRVLQLVDHGSPLSFAVRPLGNSAVRPTATGSHPWSRNLPESRQFEKVFDYGPVNPAARAYWNSSRPWGQNDGSVWQGKGSTISFSGGGFVRSRFISASIRPEFVYTQNQDFPLSKIAANPEMSPYSYPGRIDIDLPQRFGNETMREISLGESYLQANFRGLAAGVSTESLWWGPGIRNSILMSNNAGGFRHAFLKTDTPSHTRFGSFESMWIWGSVGQSDFFQDASDNPNEAEPVNDRRYITGLVVSYQPKWIRGLYVGAAQTYLLHAKQDVKFGDYFAVMNLPFFNDTKRHGRGTDDKLVSFFARWVLPASGFELYGEWARGDHTSSTRDILITPDHARAFTLGLQKVYRLSSRYVTRIGAEHTMLEAGREVGFRTYSGGTTYFYAHEGIKQGYTNEGQVIGAGIGPGSQGQFFRIDLFGPFGRFGAHALRQVFDNDLYYAVRTNNYEHQVDLAAGASWYFFFKGFEVGGSVTRIKTLNRDFVFKNDTYNTNLQLSLRYALGYR